MLLPPFTLLIVKKAHRPVTIRITGWFVVIVAMTAVLLAGGTAALVNRFAKPAEMLVAANPAPAGTVTEDVLVPVSPDSANISGTEEPGIAEFAVTRSDNGDMAFTFTVENTPADEELYFWIMVNQKKTAGTEVTVYPRGPLFRGLPVDYRNGIRHTPGGGRQLRLTFTGPEADSGFEQFRILAYEPSGGLLIDKTLAVRQNTRM